MILCVSNIHICIYTYLRMYIAYCMNYHLILFVYSWGISPWSHQAPYQLRAQGFTKTRSEMPKLHAQLTKLDGANEEVSHEILVWLVVQPI